MISKRNLILLLLIGGRKEGGGGGGNGKEVEAKKEEEKEEEAGGGSEGREGGGIERGGDKIYESVIDTDLLEYKLEKIRKKKRDEMTRHLWKFSKCRKHSLFL